MSAQMNQPDLQLSEPPVSNLLPSPRPLRLRFPFVALLLFWIATIVGSRIDKPYFIGFMFALATTALVSLCFLGWWWLNRGLRLWEKALGFLVLVAGAFVVSKNSHHTINAFVLWMAGLPIIACAIVLWLFLARNCRAAFRRIGYAVLVTAAWCAFLLVRADSATGDLHVKYHWRWTPTAEQRFLASAQPAPARATAAPAKLEVSSGDWTEFRGRNRDGIIHNANLTTNWSGTPPTLVWKHPVGPAWSSVVVVGNQVFTQEQRAEKEAVVSYDVNNGQQLWVHEDNARFDESVSGPGPRATPTFANGRLYTLGGTGILNCLDATNGQLIWTRDIKEVSGAPLPQWAFSSSPLVTDRHVIVYAGGEAGKGLLAYRLADGELAWTAAAGFSSYSSPQLNVIEGVPQILMLHDGGLVSVDPATGAKLWETGSAMKGAPRCGQPRLIEGNKLLIASIGGMGTSLIEVSKTGDKWNAATKWDSKDLKPEFPDFVVHKGYAYGFDVGIFCCLNLADGKRAWKDGRYGRGEVLLLPEKDLLLISSETGDLILLAADPSGSKELGRFKALEGKTWNHPVIRGDRIYHRNAEELACYSLSAKHLATR